MYGTVCVRERHYAHHSPLRSAFARYPDGIIEHYYCANLPEREVPQTDTADSSSTSDSYQKSMYRDLVDDTYDSTNPF